MDTVANGGEQSASKIWDERDTLELAYFRLAMSSKLLHNFGVAQRLPQVRRMYLNLTWLLPITALHRVDYRLFSWCCQSIVDATAFIYLISVHD